MLPRLYPILDIDLCRERRLEPLAVLAAFLDGGATFLQLRDKTPATGAALALADAVVARAHAAGARVIVNDRADLARLSGADGVHVGQDDLLGRRRQADRGPRRDRRALDSRRGADRGRGAARAATYIAVGPIFGTTTKDTGYAARGLDLVRVAARSVRQGSGQARIRLWRSAALRSNGRPRSSPPGPRRSR